MICDVYLTYYLLIFLCLCLLPVCKPLHMQLKSAELEVIFEFHHIKKLHMTDIFNTCLNN